MAVIENPGGFARVYGTEAVVCRDVARRQALGIAKYGTTVADNPLSLREWLQHQYEELLDAAVYCRRAIEELDRQDGEVATTVEQVVNELQGREFQ